MWKDILKSNERAFLNWLVDSAKNFTGPHKDIRIPQEYHSVVDEYIQSGDKAVLDGEVKRYFKNPGAYIVTNLYNRPGNYALTNL